MLMRYDVPTLDSLRNFTLSLHEHYTNKNNKKRLKHIELLQSLNTIDNIHQFEILMGACVYVHESIAAEYKNWPWPLNKPKNSELYNILNKILNLANNQNQMSSQSKLTYLIFFINYAEKNLTADIYNDSKAIAIQIKNSLSIEIQLLLQRPPTYQALTKEFSLLSKTYEEKCQNDSLISRALSYLWIGGHSAKRKEAITFANILNSKCSDTNALSQPELNITEEANYVLRYGALLYIMWQIESEYYVRSPSSSYLYQECQRITNINSTAELDIKSKKKDIAKLLDFISMELNSQEKTSEWQTKGLTSFTLEQMQDELTDIMSTLKNSKNNLSADQRLNQFIHTFCNRIAFTIAEGCFGTALAAFINFFAISGISMRMFISLVNPQYALLIFGLLWAKNQLQTDFTALIAYPVAPLLKDIVKAPMSGYSVIKQHFFNQQSACLNDENRALIKALYLAPHEIFSKLDKEKLELLFDREELGPVINSPHQKPQR